MPDFRDVETTPLSTYWLLRVVSICAAENHVIANQFEWLVTEILESVNEANSDDFDLSGSIHDGHVTTRGLARVTARVAALGGFKCYNAVLNGWFGDPSKPTPEPSETAHYLVIIDSQTRREILATIRDYAPDSHVEPLIEELLDMEINLNRYDAVFDSLVALLPLIDDKQLHRRGFGLLLETSRAHNWQIYEAAIESLAELAQTKVVQADEVIAHLIGLFDTGTRAQTTVADAIGETIQYAQLNAETLFMSALSQYEQSDESPKRRQAAIRLIGILGKRYPAIRERALPTVVDAVDDTDQWVRKEAARALAEINAIAPETLRSYHDEIEHLIETGSDGIAAILESCISATSNVTDKRF